MIYHDGLKIDLAWLAAFASAMIISFAEILKLALVDWWLWMLLLVLITTDTLLGSLVAWSRGEFDYKRLGKYWRRAFAWVGGLAMLSFLAVAHQGRPGAGPSMSLIRDFVSVTSCLFWFGRAWMKVGAEGQQFMRFFYRAVERATRNAEDKSPPLP